MVRRPDADHAVVVFMTRPTCATHGEKDWCECEQCGGDGMDGHDCGEDVCMCFGPEDNMRCDICRGQGGWWRCYACQPVMADPTS